MFRVVAPPSHRSAVYGTPHLPAARRANVSLRLVERETAVLPFEAAVPDEVAYCRLRVGNQVLVLQVKDSAGKDRVPVFHQPVVVGIVPSQGNQVVGKLILIGEAGEVAG